MSASLWLVPREDAPFNKVTQELISDTIPRNFTAHKVDKPSFIPHVTLTSQIDPAKTYEASGTSAQEWLDQLDLPEFTKGTNEVTLELDHLDAGDPFHRKLVIELNPDKNLSKLAASCRRQAVIGVSEQNGDAGDSGAAAEKWVQTEYAPHMSLMYADIPKVDVKNKIGLVEMQLGFGIGSLFDCCGGTLCFGGELVLVPTGEDIGQWKPIARRQTPWAMWRMSRNLI